MTIVLGGLGSFVCVFPEGKKKHLEKKDPGTEVFHQENNVNFAVAEEVKEAKAAPCLAVIGYRHTMARAALEANSRTPTGCGGEASFFRPCRAETWPSSPLLQPDNLRPDDAF